MPGKKAENVLEIRAYIKSRSQLGSKATDIHREVCSIYGEDQMSFSMVCMWVAKFKSEVQELKDAARPGRPATTQTKHNIKNPRFVKKRCQIYQETVSAVHNQVIITSS